MPKKRGDLTGQVFFRVTALERVIPACRGKDGRRRSYYRCLCECGTEWIVQGHSLVSGNTKSCGCLRADDLRVQKQRRPFGWLYNSVKRIAKYRGLIFEISYEDFLYFSSIKDCHYCGKKLLWCAHSKNKSNEGYGHNLDRKDSSLGYTKDNIAVCCPRCNQSKSNTFSYEEWKQIGNLIRSWGT